MTPFDDPFEFVPDSGGSAAGGEPPVPARPRCRVRTAGARARTRYRGDPPR